MSPLTDGTYRKLLFTYSLTPAEKQDLLNGLPLNPENNITVTEITQGTYNNGQLQKNTCGWSPSTIWTECSAGEHGEWNIGEWHNCKAEIPPKAYVAMTYSCSSELPPTGGGPGGSGDGGSSGGGSGDDGETPLCNENGVLTGLQPPLFLNPDGCSGIPTQPNVGVNQDLINELQGYPCAQNLVQQLPNLKNDLAMSMKQIFQNNKNYTIIFKPKSGLGSVDGETQVVYSTEFDNFKATININDQVLTNATKEYIFVTLYHEVIHAFLRYELFKLGATAFHEKYLGVVVGYDYDSNGNIINRFTFLPQHQEVGAFLSTLENILSLYNPNLSSTTIKAMAKAGITTMTQAEIQLNNNERDTVLGNYQGTKCP